MDTHIRAIDDAMSAPTGFPRVSETDTGEPPVPPSVSILVVDDNSTKRLALSAALAPLGFTIIEADSGLAALRCVMAQDFAVILLDVCMPGMDGPETAAIIRKRPQSQMTPIIFITAFGNDELVSTDHYAQGAVDFIFAPIPPEELRAKVSVFANMFAQAESLATLAREVQTSADQWRLLSDVAPIGIFQTDVENTYIYTNPRWSEITGIPADEAAGQTWEAIVAPQDHFGLVADLANVTEPPSEICRRFEIRRPDSDMRVVLVTSKAIPDDNGRTVGWVGTLADITAEAGAEAALSAARDEATEASRLKSDFLANMSHEIRTPMNGVIGMTDLLLETDLDPRQRDYAQTVRNSGEALLTIINDILDFSKVEAGMLEVEDVPFALRAIVDDVVDLLARPAQAKGLDLLAVVERSLPAMMSGDPGRVRQVLTNLVGNALKFTQSGEIVVRATGSLTGPEAGAIVVRFEVSDNGDGIAPDKVDEIFQPFIQSDTSTSRRYGGTGLGLAISSQLVALMGGDCGVTSTLGAGSTFWFTVPGRVVTSETTASGRLSRASGLAGVTALIVSESATLRSVLSEYLTDWGMTVAVAESSPGALATLHTASAEHRRVAVALLDWSLPGGGGRELTTALAADTALAVRLVHMTDMGHEADIGDATTDGISGSLTKPVHREDLRTALRVALGLQHAEVGPLQPTALPLAGSGEPEMARLLLAEDNLINQKVTVEMLAGAGYHVDTVMNGADAVEAVAARRYDAILMDCQMPELNGYEATAAIRALKSSSRSTPIIAMTAGARREDRDRCLAQGMDDYLSKPVSKDALLALVARSVKDSRRMTGPQPSADDSMVDDLTIDPLVFDELRLLGEATDADFLAQLVDRFVHDTEPLMAKLRTALESGEGSAVSRIVHNIKGSGAQLGGRRLALSCSRLEEKARSGSPSLGPVDLQDVEFDYQDLCRTLIHQLASSARNRTRGTHV
jgi:PAS domain S-box-containing protein